MGEKISGGCACGAIRYETEADPVVMLNCHCRDCQRSTGSGHAAVMVVPAAAVTLKGEPRYFKTVGNAGHAVDRGFCAACGSPVTVKLERMPEVLGLHAAGLDDPACYKPAMDIFTDSAHPWDAMNPDTQKMPGGFIK
jgi:hypothetical protein